MNAHPLSSPDRDLSEGSEDSDTLQRIFEELQEGRGREHVSDGNVGALIQMARRAGDAQLELLLREWRSPCGDDPDAPVLPAELPPPAPR